jgi:N-acetylglucosamine-6-phosphate deacetylase
LELKNKGELKVGNQANFVVLDKHQKVKETYINGVFID